MCLSAVENIVLDQTPRQEENIYLHVTFYNSVVVRPPSNHHTAAVLEGEIFFGSCYTAAAVPRIKEHFL